MNENKLKKLLHKEIDVLLSRYNCCIDLLNGMSEQKAKKKHGVGTPKKMLLRWCEAASGNYEVRYWTMPELRENKHLFIGDAE